LAIFKNPIIADYRLGRWAGRSSFGSIGKVSRYIIENKDVNWASLKPDEQEI